MGLDKYLKKRDFSKTNEPKSGHSAGKVLRFVVQRHHASHLHYDFRLEMDGVLKSWAVPKGPSLNPNDKRLAMRVEDHPYDYRKFEGTIPAGNYGGGVVHIFDEGTYEPLATGGEKELLKELKNGNLKFKLKGNILKGEFALVRLRNAAEENAWLLIKHNDEYAVNSAFNSENLVSEAEKKEGVDFKKKSKNTAQNLPGSRNNDFKPMLAKLASTVSDDPNWIYEKKLDGYRCLAFVQKDGGVILTSRNGIDFTNDYLPVSKALKNLKADAIIDGEIVAETASGKSEFQLLQNFTQNQAQLKFYVFDLLQLDGHDLRKLPLIKRKDLLKALMSKNTETSLIYNDHIVGKGTALFKRAKKENWEGIIGKYAESTYTSDRSSNWLKFKWNKSQEAIIIGFTQPAGSRSFFGALLLAMYSNNILVYTGKCGTGFSEETLRMLHKKMKPLIRVTQPVEEKVSIAGKVTWLAPKLVCDVEFSEWTKDNHLRHPVFKGLRNDKNPEEVTFTPAENLEVAALSKRMDKKQENEAIMKFGKKEVKLTNLKKLYWPDEKITKGEMIGYYQEVGEFILPYLKDKPLSLNRHPNGIKGASFFQKDLDIAQVPKWIKSAPLHSESNNKDIDYLICNDMASLLWMANLGCIEINPWLSSYKKPAFPDFGVLDLDPHDIDFIEVVRVAKTAKSLLDQMKVPAYVKTSGSKGLHIFIPTAKKYEYGITKDFIQYLGELILEIHPKTTSLERSPARRKNKIYLDFLQNRKGQTIAAPYSLRPKPGATVSTPLHWDEITDHLSLKDYTIFNTLERLKTHGDIWEGLWSVKANLKTALKNLQSYDK